MPGQFRLHDDWSGKTLHVELPDVHWPIFLTPDHVATCQSILFDAPEGTTYVIVLWEDLSRKLVVGL